MKSAYMTKTGDCAIISLPTLILDGSTQSTLFHFLCRSARFIIFILPYLKLYVLFKDSDKGCFISA